MNAAVKREIGIYTGLLLVTGGIMYTVVNRNVKKNQLAEILRVINSGTNQYGGIKDLQQSNAFDKNYWKVSGSTTLLPNQTVVSYGNDIYNAFDQYGGTYDDEQTALATFKKMVTKAQVSQVADYFNNRYKRDLGIFIEKIDKGTNPSDLTKYINGLPNK